MTAKFTFFFFAVFSAAVVAGWEWPDIAKIMPVYVAAIPGFLLVLVQLYRDATDWEGRRGERGGAIDMDEVTDVQLDKKIERRRTLIYFSWFIGGALGIWLLGIVIALPLLVFLYALIEGREKWSTSLIMAACTYLLIWGLFEYMLESRWPPGAFFR
ncbi:MAG: tripartite tricarboxylate transporter TctB family protein [Candidatus Entotheonellia bacterium]